ncbi:MAG: AEC family transporter [Sphaerochaetaceae bacterium]|jgi:predicted permease
MIFSSTLKLLFPLFSKIGLGYVFKKGKLLNQQTLYELNTLIFKVLLPLLIFINIYETDFNTIESFSLLWFSAISIIVIFIISMIAIPPPC